MHLLYVRKWQMVPFWAFRKIKSFDKVCLKSQLPRCAKACSSYSTVADTTMAQSVIKTYAILILSVIINLCKMLKGFNFLFKFFKRIQILWKKLHSSKGKHVWYWSWYWCNGTVAPCRNTHGVPMGLKLPMQVVRVFISILVILLMEEKKKKTVKKRNEEKTKHS